MEKRIILSILMTAVLFGADFRALKWGMSTTEVIIMEGSPEVQLPGVLTYNKMIGGEKASTMMIFVNDSLAFGGYTFKLDYVNPYSFIANYYRIQGILIEKYGEPFLDEVFKKGDFFSDDPGLALKYEYRDYDTIWITDATTISLSMSSKKGEIVIRLLYTSNKLQKSLSKMTQELMSAGF